MKLTATILAVLAAFQSFSQRNCNQQISGRVLDIGTNDPLSYATIKVVGSDIGVIAEIDGSFTLTNLCGQEVNLEIRFIGYKSVIHHHDFRNRDDVDKQHTIYLAPDENLLESVVVEAEAIVTGNQSMAVEKLDRAELATKTTQSLASAVGDIQGVTFTSAGSNVQRPVIHGLYGNRILVINNGVKHGFQNWGTDHAPEIDIASADNVSVLKGAAGVRYGPEALGGVVLVEGNPLDLSQELYGRVASGYQSNGQGYFANASFGAGSNRFSYHLGGNYERLGDRRAADYLLTNTGMEELSANAGFRYHLPSWDFKVYYSYVAQDLGLLRSSVAESGTLLDRSIKSDRPLIINDFSYEIGEPNQVTTHHLAKLEVDWNTDFGRLALILSQQINLREEYDVRRNAERPIIDLQLNTTDTRLEWDHPSAGGLEGTIGIQYFSQNNDNNPGTFTTPFIPNYNTHRISAYAIESIERSNTTYELGLRLDHEYNSVRGREISQDIFRNEYTFTNFTASLGMVRELSSYWKLRTNIGSAWRPPNTAELYSFGQHSFKGQFGIWRNYFNENGAARTDRVLSEDDKPADPERGYKWINELTYKKGKGKLTMTAYTHYIENFTFDRPVTVSRDIRNEVMPIFFFEQANAAFVGADLSYSSKFGKNLQGRFGASYLWSKNVEENEPLINQPPLNIDAELSWETPTFLGLDFSKFTAEASYTFRQFQAPRTIPIDEIIRGEVSLTQDSEIFDFADAPDGYFLANMRWVWKSGRFGGQLEVQNLLNTSYRDYLNEMRYFADDLGRNFLVSFNYKF